MKRLLTLLTATAVMVLMFASAAPAVVHLCSDHPNQQSAQAALNQDPSLAPTLDPDGDGVACEDFFGAMADRKSTRLNSSHANISYAVFCLKKKNRMRPVWSMANGR